MSPNHGATQNHQDQQHHHHQSPSGSLINHGSPHQSVPAAATTHYAHTHLTWAHPDWQQQHVPPSSKANADVNSTSHSALSAVANNANISRSQASASAAARPPTRRAPIACRRCRRLRSKCIHENAEPPCQSCRTAGPAVATECVFAARGRQDNDREFRRKRVKLSDADRNADTVVKERQSSVTLKDTHIKTQDRTAPVIQQQVIDPRLSFPSSKDPWDFLPPYDELVEGCRVFGTSCIQLGFMPKALFLERLAKDRRSVSVFLLLSILSISARFTPSLIRRYGSGGKAGEHFMNCAGQLVVNEMYEPTLERTQAFFLLGVAEWGRGARNRSSIHMGISVRMAGILRLHREETYELPKSATADNVVDSEVARRTFWCIQCHDNLYTGHNAPISFNPSDISTLLPCEESDFAFGRVPTERAALAGTQAAKANPSLCSIPSRSLFATLMQVHNLWGQVARRACRTERERDPWSEKSEYKALTKVLRLLEEDMPDRHKWSLWNFRGYKAESVELAYLSVVTITRLNNIVIRRIYLEDILRSALKSKDSNPRAPPGFWEEVSFELFSNLGSLYEAIDTFFTLRSSEEGYPTMLVFCIYMCGSLASYLWKWPHLCPGLASGADKILQRSLEVLANMQHAWPQATTWLAALRKVSIPMRAKKAQARPLSAMSSQERFLSAADGLDPPRPTPAPTPTPDASTNEVLDPALISPPTLSTHQEQRLNTESLNLLSDVAVDHMQQSSGSSEAGGAAMRGAAAEVAGAGTGTEAIGWGSADQDIFLSPADSLGGIPLDHFETDLSNFLQGHAHLGLMEGW